MTWCSGGVCPCAGRQPLASEPCGYPTARTRTEALIGRLSDEPQRELDCRRHPLRSGRFELFPGLVQDKAFAVSYPLTNNTSTSIVLKPSASVTSDGAPFAVVGTIPDYCAPISPGQTAAITMYANSDFDPDTDPAIALGLVLPWGRSCADTDRQPIIIPAETVSSFPACGPTCAG